MPTRYVVMVKAPTALAARQQLKKQYPSAIVGAAIRRGDKWAVDLRERQ